MNAPQTRYICKHCNDFTFIHADRETVIKARDAHCAKCKPFLKHVAGIQARNAELQELLKNTGPLLSKVNSLMYNLAERWVDESKYENINDYAVPIQKALPKGCKVVKMSKRPFGAFISTKFGTVQKVVNFRGRNAVVTDIAVEVTK